MNVTAKINILACMLYIFHCDMNQEDASHTLLNVFFHVWKLEFDTNNKRSLVYEVVMSFLRLAL